MSTRKTTAGKSGAGRATATPVAVPADDPPPVAPERPAPDECCHSGCIPCVYDLYDEAMDRYRDALKAWRARHEPQQP
ncbi:oxidoreductase-like domain-containing protein [Achromobacter sp. NFACC18-2]|uniref:oxidoreductase-like domain-containing protein n=1 Tax=Achromobacter sp. NFACC18-2 TaxID=1564112 RepID=UPI0008CAB816|nr:oxidoreductase-like domain-containing protein [Achromobacter sp. NFACC18-2]SEJ60493.1 Oxidoreductase-like protein, N-terminal [Achromobacter sp. NFACC18-2]